MADSIFGTFQFFGNGDQPHEDSEAVNTTQAKQARRRTTACTELSTRYEYRRAFSEVKLLEAMHYVKLEQGKTYNFITAGDVDSLSFLKVVINQHDLDHVLCSTWCMAAEDILQLQMWFDAGKIKHLDMYMGEIFPGSYRVEWKMVKDFYAAHPEAGRAAIFRNHSKIYAGCNKAENFFLAYRHLQTSTPTHAQSKAASLSIKASTSSIKAILTA